MRRTNYITILDWMLSELKLTGNDLIVYALIYGFSQDGESDFHGGHEWIAKWLNMNYRTALNVLHRLEEKGLIARISYEQGKVIRWTATPCKNDTPENFTPLKKVQYHPCKKFSTTPEKNSGNNNNSYNNKDNNNNTLTLTSECVPARTPEEEEFDAWMAENFPNVSKMRRPLTQKEAKALKEQYGKQRVIDMLEEMENWPKLNRNGVALYTLRAWLRKEDKKDAEGQMRNRRYMTPQELADLNRQQQQESIMRELTRGNDNNGHE